MIQRLLAEQWLYDNEDMYTRATSPGKRKSEFFHIYNTLTGLKKATTTCGRCLSGMRLQLTNIKKGLDQMEVFKVYRTEKGNLSFKVQPEHAYTIRAHNKESAKDALIQLKKDDKQFYGK